MRRIILALAIALPAFGAAHADDFFSTLQFPEVGATSSRYQQGDAAPRAAVKNPRRGTDFSSTAPMETSPRQNKISSRYVYGDAPLPSTASGTTRGFGHSSRAQMSAGGQRTIGASPRIFDGSN